MESQITSSTNSLTTSVLISDREGGDASVKRLTTITTKALQCNRKRGTANMAWNLSLAS